MKSLCFKSVREDYSSVYAPLPLGRRYTIGSVHDFEPKYPAHVFLPKNDNLKTTFENAFYRRKEACASHRVVICLGEDIKKVIFPVMRLWEIHNRHILKNKVWLELYDLDSIHTTTHLEVIGEIYVPNQEYCRGGCNEPTVINDEEVEIIKNRIDEHYERFYHPQ